MYAPARNDIVVLYLRALAENENGAACWVVFGLRWALFWVLWWALGLRLVFQSMSCDALRRRELQFRR